MELGARKLDFIGQKFETAQLIANLYNQAYTSQSNAQNAKQIGGLLGTITGANGLCEDMRDGYSYTRLEYSQLWLRENRPYWFRTSLCAMTFPRSSGLSGASVSGPPATSGEIITDYPARQS